MYSYHTTTPSLAIHNIEVSIYPIPTRNIEELRCFSISTFDIQIRRNIFRFYHGADGARGFVFTGRGGAGKLFLKVAGLGAGWGGAGDQKTVPRASLVSSLTSIEHHQFILISSILMAVC